MNPIWFSQALVWIGVIQGIASQVQDACGSQSHTGLIAGAVLVVMGKIGHIVAQLQADEKPRIDPKP